MNRDQLITIQKMAQNAASAAEWACYEAQEKMAEAGVGAQTGALSFLLTGFVQTRDLEAEQQLTMLDNLGRFIKERCDALEASGVDIGHWKEHDFTACEK